MLPDHKSSAAIVEQLEPRRLLSGQALDQAWAFDAASQTLATTTATYVRGGAHAESNFGNHKILVVKKASDSNTRLAYLSFDIAALPAGGIASATLRLFGKLATSDSGVPVSVYTTSSTGWSENEINWDTRPAISGGALDGKRISGTLGRWYEWDVTSAVTSARAAGQQRLTLVLQATRSSDAQIWFNSDDALLYGPELAVQAETLATESATYVRGGSASGSNFGSADELVAKEAASDDNTRQAYLKLDLSIAAAISTATLRLHGRLSSTSDGSVQIDVYSAGNTSWSESTLTWNNKPATSTLRGAFSVSGTTARWYDLDLSSFLKAEKAAGHDWVTLVLRGGRETSAQAIFDSDDSSAPPYLVINGGNNLATLQQAYVKQKYGMFIHFGYETFTDNLDVSPDADRFDPSGLDTDQWAAVAKASGMKYGVLTTKHHSGYALWDSSRSSFDVASSNWYRDEIAKGRSGDVPRRYVDSFRKAGLGVGLYYSVWDKHNGITATSDPAWATKYVEDELTQLLTRYGPIDVLWTDGWGWEVGYSAVRWQDVYEHIKQISPNTLLMENNHEFNLAHTDIAGWEKPGCGTVPADNTLPAEVCDTIRADASWHYRSYDPPLRSASELASTGRTANARGAAYLLNAARTAPARSRARKSIACRRSGTSGSAEALARGKDQTKRFTPPPPALAGWGSLLQAGARRGGARGGRHRCGRGRAA